MQGYCESEFANGHVYKFDPTLNFEVGAPSAGQKIIHACDNMRDTSYGKPIKYICDVFNFIHFTK